MAGEVPEKYLEVFRLDVLERSARKNNDVLAIKIPQKSGDFFRRTDHKLQILQVVGTARVIDHLQGDFGADELVFGKLLSKIGDLSTG